MMEAPSVEPLVPVAEAVQTYQERPDSTAEEQLEDALRGIPAGFAAGFRDDVHRAAREAARQAILAGNPDEAAISEVVGAIQQGLHLSLERLAHTHLLKPFHKAMNQRLLEFTEHNATYQRLRQLERERLAAAGVTPEHQAEVLSAWDAKNPAPRYVQEDLPDPSRANGTLPEAYSALADAVDRYVEEAVRTAVSAG